MYFSMMALLDGEACQFPCRQEFPGEHGAVEAAGVGGLGGWVVVGGRMRWCGRGGCLEGRRRSWRTGYMKSPEPAPVKGGPVRLAPWAPGARPRMRMRARGSPKPGTGRAQ